MFFLVFKNIFGISDLNIRKIMKKNMGSKYFWKIKYDGKPIISITTKTKLSLSSLTKWDSKIKPITEVTLPRMRLSKNK